MKRENVLRYIIEWNAHSFTTYSSGDMQPLSTDIKSQRAGNSTQNPLSLDNGSSDYKTTDFWWWEIGLFTKEKLIKICDWL